MRRIAPGILHAVVLAVGLLTAFHPTILSGGRLLQTDPGDTLLNHYILEHSWRWVADPAYSSSFWSPPCFAPAQGTLAFSENLLGTAPVYWCARAVVDEVAAYQIWMMAVAMLTYLATAWVMSAFGATPWLAALAAACYAFGLPRVNQLGHQQLLASLYSPLAVYWTWRFLNGPSTGRMALALLFVFLQLLASIYLGWFLVLGLTVFTGFYLSPLVGTFRRPTHQGSEAPPSASRFQRLRASSPEAVVRVRQYVSREWRSLVKATLLGGAAVALLFAPYLAANRGFKRSYRGEVRLMLPRLDSYLSPPPSSYWAHLLPPTDGPLSHEHHLFPGMVFFVMVGATVIAAATRRERMPPLVVVSLATMAILMLVSLRVGKISLWRGVHGVVPGAQAIRAVTRIFTIAYLFGWIGAAVAWSRWLDARRSLATVAGVVLLTIGLAEQVQRELPAFDPTGFHAEVARLRGELRGAEMAYVELDPGSPFWVSQIAAMWAGLQADVPVVNGYSGRTPQGYPDEKSIFDREALMAWLGGRVDACRVIAAPSLAQFYPAPDVPLNAGPELRALDFRPYRSVLRAESTREWPTSLMKPSPPLGSVRPAP